MKKQIRKKPLRKKPPADWDDATPLPDSMLRQMRPAREVLPHIVAAYEKRMRGRPSLGDAAKVPLSLRIAPDVLHAYQATGEGWQTRMNDVLARGAKKLAGVK